MFRLEAFRLRFAYILAISFLFLGLTADPALALVTAKDFPGMIPQNNAWWDFFRFIGYFGSLIGVCVWGVRKGCPFIDTLCLAIFLTPIGGALYVYLYRVPGSEDERKRIVKSNEGVLRMSNINKPAPVQKEVATAPTQATPTSPTTVVEQPAETQTAPVVDPIEITAVTPVIAPVEKVEKTETPVPVPTAQKIETPVQTPVAPAVEKPLDAPLGKPVVRPSGIKPAVIIRK